MAVIQEETTIHKAQEIFRDQKQHVLTLRKEYIKFRKERLQKLRTWVLNNRADIQTAAYDDFRKNAAEVDGVEIFHVIQEINHAIANLDDWTRPRKIDAPMTMLGSRATLHVEPRGVCLIIAPWNYPFSLAIGPLVSALAAGNAVIIKPSELTPNVSALIAKMITELFPSAVAAVCEGGPEVSKFLLSLPFDHIFFTGSPSIGKVVMRAAAENLTSVTLELGGKSPAFVTEKAVIEEAAKRIAVAKFINNGQTCIAPDYVLVHERIFEKFLDALIKQTKKLFLSANETFDTTSNYCRIVNEKHFLRLNALLQDALTKGAKLEFGGQVDQSTRFMHPIVISQIPMDAKLMEEEIFGPILPIVAYKNLDDAISIVNSKPKPLALYIFSKNSEEQQKVLTETSAGGTCVNDCAIHFLHQGLPFGGVNNSGIGKSHGYHGFLAFSNEKPVLKQRHGVTSISPFYPPYTSLTKKLMSFVLKWM
ncbi:aldehyde dehydrogenase family protein [Pseudochryseolinea flava]|uniref:Aldehyde dehydrogenase n=1 Tax=Pseudochryseolinea flava TaxID=2059302 RepID=A0A364Y7Y9_9BACT|nr:aldehyde dehydrogenase family protein [Pseudochryseolinea flava]RAW03226.1 aldehyde dehydrogenase family protein [Pseudochryseolinea flava]